MSPSVVPTFEVSMSQNQTVTNHVTPELRKSGYSEQEVTAMLNRAGVKEISRLPFQCPNDSAIICGMV